MADVASEIGQLGPKPCECATVVFTSGKSSRAYWSRPTTCTCEREPSAWEAIVPFVAIILLIVALGFVGWFATGDMR